MKFKGCILDFSKYKTIFLNHDELDFNDNELTAAGVFFSGLICVLQRRIFV